MFGSRSQYLLGRAAKAQSKDLLAQQSALFRPRPHQVSFVSKSPPREKMDYDPILNAVVHRDGHSAPAKVSGYVGCHLCPFFPTSRYGLQAECR